MNWPATTFAVALALATGRARADGPTQGTLFSPDGPSPFRLRAGVGVLVDVLPTRVVQSEIRQFPQLTAEARYGLPLGLSLDAHLSAIVLSNELSLGLRWAHRVRWFSVSVQDQEGFSYGALGTAGFDATSWGHVNRPGLSIGAQLGRERFSLTGELIFTFGQYAKLGDSQVVARAQSRLAGTALTLVVETSLDSGAALYLGIGILRTDVDYQAWIAFSDNRARLPYPRFLAGYEF